MLNHSYDQFNISRGRSQSPALCSSGLCFSESSKTSKLQSRDSLPRGGGCTRPTHVSAPGPSKQVNTTVNGEQIASMLNQTYYVLGRCGFFVNFVGFCFETYFFFGLITYFTVFSQLKFSFSSYNLFVSVILKLPGTFLLRLYVLYVLPLLILY